MPESDVTKMKVADLKRELKLRGLPLNGNKNDLQDRLQTALLEGDISLEDSAISDAIDDDVSFTDEDEHKLLDEDLLLKSPVNTPTTTLAATLEQTGAVAGTDTKPEANAGTTPAKKIVLKRNNSQQSIATLTTAGTTTITAKENAAPEASAADAATPESASAEQTKTIRTQRKPIVVGGGRSAATGSAEKKLSELTIQERLELRAKKFGISLADKAATTTSALPAASPIVNKSSSASIRANKGNKETDEQQKAALKRRAERFGQVVPEKTPKTVADERLQKRKARFGAPGAAPAETKDQSPATGDWAEKARARLERFKGAKTDAASAPTPAAAAGDITK